MQPGVLDTRWALALHFSPPLTALSVVDAAPAIAFCRNCRPLALQPL
ncbi:hypothetical protein EV132_103364 [Rhizobium sullae]|uniref:Uncharacterized protein n=1 Tax=Rhizobium sullae TaxID=50338 RepID=A0A4R3QBT9_RHISU|nr:hypothetical protein EV132_103364 [Rhizobium sullae]